MNYAQSSQEEAGWVVVFVRFRRGAMANGVLNHEERRCQAVFEDTFPRALGAPWDWGIATRSGFSRWATPAGSAAGDKGGIGSVADRHCSIVYTPGGRSRAGQTLCAQEHPNRAAIRLQTYYAIGTLSGALEDSILCAQVA